MQFQLSQELQMMSSATFTKLYVGTASIISGASFDCFHQLWWIVP